MSAPAASVAFAVAAVAAEVVYLHFSSSDTWVTHPAQACIKVYPACNSKNNNNNNNNPSSPQIYQCSHV
jgi:hypothetical protein